MDCMIFEKETDRICRAPYCPFCLISYYAPETTMLKGKRLRNSFNSSTISGRIWQLKLNTFSFEFTRHKYAGTSSDIPLHP